MKKLLVSTLLLTSLTGAIGSASNTVEAASQSLCTDEIKPPLLVKPNLKSATTLKSFVNGSYKYKDFAIDSKFSHIKKIVPQKFETQLTRTSFGTTAVAKFSNGYMTGYHPSRFAKETSIPVKDIAFDYKLRDNVLRTDIKKVLGKPIDSDRLNKTLLSETYDNLVIQYILSNKKWFVDQVDILDLKVLDASPNTDTNERPGKLKNVTVKPFSTTQLKAMKAGNFKYHNIKLGMSPYQVSKVIGQSNEDSYQDLGFMQLLTQEYGKSDDISLEYDTNDCNNVYKLSSMFFNYDGLKQTMPSIEKGLGKATQVEYGSYTSEDDNGKKTVIKTVFKRYNHLWFNAEYINKKWIVTDVQYVK